MKYSSVILSAGSGLRTGLKRNKNLQELCGKKVIDYSIDFFLNDDNCDQIILVVSERDFDLFSLSYSSIVDKVIIGGNNRQTSVNNSLKYIQNSFILIHDGARPLISSDFIAFFVENIPNYDAISIGSKLKDTIHIVGNSRISSLIERDNVLAVQTPQCFRFKLLEDVHKKAKEDGFFGTDDLSLVYKYSDIKPYIYVSDTPNIKFTTIDDFKFLEVIINENRTK